MQAGDYGLGFWQPVAAAYKAGAQEAKDSAATVGALVGTKNTLEDQIDTGLTKLFSLLEAQYLTETELAAKRRELGYLKEYN